MRIKLKFFNITGADTEHSFESVPLAESFLNEVLHYSNAVELSSSFNEMEPYTKDTKLAQLMRDALDYGEGCVIVYPINN